MSLFFVRPLSSAAHEQLLPRDGVQEAIKERNPSLEMTPANERRRSTHEMQDCACVIRGCGCRTSSRPEARGRDAHAQRRLLCLPLTFPRNIPRSWVRERERETARVIPKVVPSLSAQAGGVTERGTGAGGAAVSITADCWCWVFLL